MAKYIIAETEEFQKDIKKPQLKNIYEKIRDFVYPQLRINPYFGPHIKKLKGQFESVYRYRISNFRLFYKIDQQKNIIFIMAIRDRKEAYK